MKKHLIGTAVAGATIAFGAVVFVRSGATGIVKKRMDMMKTVAEQMKTIGQMAKGEEDLDGREVENAAGKIANHAGKIPDLFPNGSADPPARPFRQSGEIG